MTSKILISRFSSSRNASCYQIITFICKPLCVLNDDNFATVLSNAIQSYVLAAYNEAIVELVGEEWVGQFAEIHLDQRADAMHILHVLLRGQYGHVARVKLIPVHVATTTTTQHY